MHCGEHVGAKLAMQRTSLPYVVALELFFTLFQKIMRLAFAVMLRPKAGVLCGSKCWQKHCPANFLRCRLVNAGSVVSPFLIWRQF